MKIELNIQSDINVAIRLLVFWPTHTFVSALNLDFALYLYSSDSYVSANVVRLSEP